MKNAVIYKKYISKRLFALILTLVLIFLPATVIFASADNYPYPPTPTISRQWDYAVVLNPVTSSGTLASNSAPIVVSYADGTVGYMYKVFDATKNTVISPAILLNSTLKPGDYIGISQNTNISYEVSKLADVVNGVTERASMADGTESYAVGGGTTVSSYDQGTGLITLDGGSAINSNATRSAVITDDSKIIAVNIYDGVDSGGNPTGNLLNQGDANAFMATIEVISKDSLANYYNNGNITDAGFIASGDGSAAGGVNALWVTLNTPVTMDTTNRQLKWVGPNMPILEDRLMLIIGNTYNLTVVPAPTIETVWTSRDNTVATVNQNGEITPVSLGTTVITATVGIYNYSVNVTIVNSITPRQWDYAVVLNPVTGYLTSNSMPIPIGYADGTIGWLYKIFDATKNTVINNAIVMSGNLKPGDYIGISQNANGTYEVSKINNIVNGVFESYSDSMVNGTDNYAVGGGATVSSFNQANGLLTLNGSNKKSNASAPTTSAIVINTSHIIAVNIYDAVDADGNPASNLLNQGDPNAVIATAALISKDSLANYYYSGSVIDAGFVAGGDGSTAGIANALWVTLNTPVVIVTPPDRYGLVVEPNGSTNPTAIVDAGVLYCTKQAYVYTTGQIINICSQNVNDLAAGNLVVIKESQRVTLLGVAYYVVSTADNTLAHTGYSDYNPNNANPNTFSASDIASNIALNNASNATITTSKTVSGTETNGLTMYAGKITGYAAGASATIALNGTDPINGSAIKTITLQTNNYNLIAGADLRSQVTNAGKSSYISFTPVPDMSMSSVKGLNGISNDVFAANKNDIYAVAYVDNATDVTVSVTFIFGSFNQAQSDALEWPWGNASTSSGTTITGTVKSYNPNNPTTVRLLDGTTEIATTTINPVAGSGQTTQTFTLTDVPAGTYTLEVTKTGHTKYTIKNITVGSNDIDLRDDSRASISLITLVGGDITGDGKVTIADLNVVLNNFNKSAGLPVESSPDVTGDGKVTIADLNAVLNNFNRVNVDVDFSK